MSYLKYLNSKMNEGIVPDLGADEKYNYRFIMSSD